jgi:multidrug efflux pump subunit AcrA (membrane-fusion protein)
MIMKQKLFIALVGLSLLISACSAGKAPAATPEVIPTVLADTTIMAEGRLEPVSDAQVAYNAGGIISEVLVAEGQQVKKGASLIRLGGETDKAYAAAKLELATAQQAYNDLLNSSPTDAAQAVIDLKAAQEAFDKADDYLNYLKDSKRVPQTETKTFLIQTWKGYQYQYKSKSFKGPAPEDWIIDAKNDLALKKAQLDEAQKKYDRLKGGVDTDQLAVLEARLKSAQAGLAALEVTAPFDGTVAKLDGKVGESIAAGSVAVTLADFSSWLIKTTDLTEIDVVQLTVGQPVTVTLDAIPDTTFNGTIQSIGQTYAENQGDVVYEVTILLNDTHPAMRWGMTASVKFANEN